MGLVCGLLGMALLLSPWGRSLEQAWGLNWLFQLRGPLPPSSQVAVISLDRASAERLGYRQRPDRWPRAIHGELVSRLQQAGAAVIVFDLWFEQATDPADDQIFASAIADAGNVLMLERLSKRAITGGQQADLELLQLHPPHPLFGDRVLASAPFTLPKVPIAVSQFWTFDKNAGDAPSLATLATLAAHRDAHDQFSARIAQRQQVEGAGNPTTLRGLNKLRDRVQTTVEHVRLVCAGIDVEPCLLAEKEDNPALATVSDLYLGPSSRVLNLYGAPRTLTTVPYWKAVAPHAADNPGWLAQQVAGRIVLIGVSSESQPDQADAFITPYSDKASGHDIAGVEILATAVANLMDRSTIAVLPPGWQFLSIALFGVMVGIASRTLAPLVAIGASLMIGATWLWVALELFSHSRLWAPTAIPLAFQLPGALVVGLWRQSVVAHSERQRLGDAFSRYLPSEVVDRLRDKGFHPGKDRHLRFGVCLNTDAERYTDFAENLPPTELADRVNRYYEGLFEPVTRHGGWVSDVVGDSMLAVWTSPRKPKPQTLCRAACLAALDILDKESRPDREPGLRTRMGLHAGELVMSHVGAGDHYEYRAVGDTVNTSARLQGLNKQLQTYCLASSQTLDGIDDIPARRIGRFTLKGKRHPVEIYALCHAPNTAFDQALDAFEGGCWADAFAGFTAVLKQRPQDGPARYYADLSARYMRSPPGTAVPGVIWTDGNRLV